MISPRHEAALHYAAADIPIFPCRVGSKGPATLHSFKDATTDPEIVNAWWSEADYNVAAEPDRAGWAVVDIDPGADLSALDLSATFTVTTPRGGEHRYYRGSLPPSAGKLTPHVDTRGRGSYVLLPPSVVDGKPYATKDGTFPPGGS